MLSVPYLGHGIGLRTVHYREILQGLGGAKRDASSPGGEPSLEGVEWFEAISENFFGPGGNPRRVLRAVRERLPVVLHGVALSLGGTDPANTAYLDNLAQLCDEIRPALVSDHLCWGAVDGRYAHDLLPLPFTEEALAQVVARVGEVQDRLRRQILVENVSSYVRFTHSSMSEWDFLAALAERADCGILLDVNNVFVSAHNHGFDAREFIARIPRGRVGQIHLAGHSTRGALLLDTHDHAVRAEVWELYRFALETHGPTSTLVEWDDHIPPFARVAAEAATARTVAAEVDAARVPAGAPLARKSVHG